MILCEITVYDYLASHPYPAELIDETSDISASLTEDKGRPLGTLSYQVEGNLLTITDWSHYNWHNADPVRKAFRSLLGSLPECVDVISVRDDPTAFWTSLGFESPYKGSDMLIYDKSSLDPIPY